MATEVDKLLVLREGFAVNMCKNFAQERWAQALVQAPPPQSQLPLGWAWAWAKVFLKCSQGASSKV